MRLPFSSANWNIGAWSIALSAEREEGMEMHEGKGREMKSATIQDGEKGRLLRTELRLGLGQQMWRLNIRTKQRVVPM